MLDLAQMEDQEARQWERVRDILDAALALTPDLRPGYLADACGSDAGLRAEIESLIAASERSAFLDRDLLPSLTPTLNMTVAQTGRTIGNYKIVEGIGKGGMGMVFQAIDTRLGRTVALKVISDLRGAGDEKIRFFREAKAASALNHPNIVTIYEYDTDHEVDFIAMEYIRGNTLHALLAAERRAHPKPCSDYAVQAAGAVAAAHAAGIVHRDLKTKNIMVTEQGTVKVLDFGLAKQTGIGGPKHSRARCLAHRRICRRSKPRASPPITAPTSSSFGVILYEMACGQRPFGGPDLPSTLYAVVHHDPLAPDKVNPTVPSRLARIDRPLSQQEPGGSAGVRGCGVPRVGRCHRNVCRGRAKAETSVARGHAIVAGAVAAIAGALGIWLPRPDHSRTLTYAITYTIIAQQMAMDAPSARSTSRRSRHVPQWMAISLACLLATAELLLLDRPRPGRERRGSSLGFISTRHCHHRRSTACHRLVRFRPKPRNRAAVDRRIPEAASAAGRFRRGPRSRGLPAYTRLPDQIASCVCLCDPGRRPVACRRRRAGR